MSDRECLHRFRTQRFPAQAQKDSKRIEHNLVVEPGNERLPNFFAVHYLLCRRYLFLEAESDPVRTSTALILVWLALTSVDYRLEGRKYRLTLIW